MARAVVTFEDNGEAVDIRMEFDPPLMQGEDAQCTWAQSMAVECVRRVKEIYRDMGIEEGYDNG